MTAFWVLLWSALAGFIVCWAMTNPHPINFGVATFGLFVSLHVIIAEAVR
jgi:hypothetical protein